jgi:hypothetical protein
MASKPNSTVIPSNARDLPFLLGDCNISVSFNKSLRQISSARYNRAVDNYVQAPTAAPIFLLLARQSAGKRNHLFESDAPLNLSLSAISALLKTCHPQPAYSQSLPHSLKNNPGYGVEGPTNAFPFWERHPVAAIASQIAGLSPRSWQIRAQRTRGHATHGLESRPTIGTASRSALSIFTCNKKAIYSKLTPNRRKRTESEQRLQGIPQRRIVLQEN